MKLQLGCMNQRIDGFSNVDIVPGPNVDFIMDAKQLDFQTGSVEEIYASHILEHFQRTETQKALDEWSRVLVPGGILWLSVPSVEQLFKVYQKMGYWTEWLDRVMHGDQEAPVSFHYRSFTWPILQGLLHNAGFKSFIQVDSLKYDISDASKIVDSIFQISISLCVKAFK